MTAKTNRNENIIIHKTYSYGETHRPALLENTLTLMTVIGLSIQLEIRQNL